MKAFLFKKLSKHKTVFEDKVVTELPDVLIIAEDEGAAHYELDRCHPNSYDYNFIGEVKERMLIEKMN